MSSWRGTVAAVTVLIAPGVGHAQEVPPSPSEETAPAAQDDTGHLADIVVTAQKRAQNVQDVPIAITALTADQLTTSGIVSTSQLNVAIPGVNIRQTVGSFQPSIRGVGTSANNVENPVALYIDDVYYPFQREGARELNDLEQVAVLKGPQGTLFGRNATGGVIQLTTRRPQYAFSGDGGISIDNYATLRSDVFVTGGLSEKIAGSLAASYATQGQGWGENATTGNETSIIHENWAVRGKLLFESDDRSEITLIGDYQSRDEDLAPVNRAYPGAVLALPGGLTSGSVYDAALNIDSNLTLKAGGVSLKVSRDVGFAEITSITAFRQARATGQWDVDATPTQGQNNFVENSTRMISQEVQVVSPADKDFHWTLGGYYLNYRNGVTPFDRYFYGPLVRNNIALTTIRDRETVESIAPFAQIDFTILPDTRLTLGGRWTWEKRSFEATTTSTRTDGTAAPPVMQELTRSVDRPSWRISLDHEFSDTVLGYASYNRGFKSGGFNITQPTAPAYDPETLDAFEVGLKTELFDRSLRLNTAGFYYRYRDLQLTRVVAGALTIVNAASAELYGVEADFEARLTREFRLTGGISLIHSEYTDFPGAQFIALNPTGGLIVTQGNAAGNRLQLAQEISASLTATYSKEFSFGTIDLNATESYNGDYYFDPDNFARQPAYHMINASAGWTSPSDNLTATAFVRNLLNEKIIGQVSSATAIGLTATYPYPPRTYGLSLRYRF